MGTGTGIGRVRGLGPAGHGAKNWFNERISGAANLALLIWLLVSVLRLPSLDHEAVTAWLSSPLVAVPMILFVLTTFWHLKLCMTVVIEDYVRNEGLKFGSLILLGFLSFAGAALASFAVLQIAFRGAAT